MPFYWSVKIWVGKPGLPREVILNLYFFGYKFSMKPEKRKKWNWKVDIRKNCKKGNWSSRQEDLIFDYGRN